MPYNLKTTQFTSYPVSQNYGTTFNPAYQCAAVMTENDPIQEAGRQQEKLDSIANQAGNFGFGLGQILLKVKERCAATLIRSRTWFFDSFRYFRGEQSPNIELMTPVLSACVKAQVNSTKTEAADRLSLKNSEALSRITECVDEEVNRWLHVRFPAEAEAAQAADKSLKQQQECVQGLEPEARLRHGNAMQTTEDFIEHLNRFNQNFTQWRDDYGNSIDAIRFLDTHFPYPIVDPNNPEPKGLSESERLQLDQKLDKSSCKAAITMAYGARKNNMREVKGIIDDFNSVIDGCAKKSKHRTKKSKKH